MTRSNILPGISFLRRHRPTLTEFEILLDLLPEATILVDLQGEHILLANARATELTAFTRVDLVKQDVDTLFTSLPTGGLGKYLDADDNVFTAQIRTHNSTSIEVEAILTRLDTEASWVLVTLEPTSTRQQQADERVRRAKVYEYIQKLVGAPQEVELARSIQAALQAGQDLTGATILSVYLNDANKPELTRTTTLGTADVLPEHIPPTEMEMLLETQLWISGKRASTGLKQAARAANLSYLASTPLGQPGARAGLIVIAGMDIVPSEEILPLLEILGTTITGIIQQHTLIENLMEHQKSMGKAITLGGLVQESVLEGVIRLAADLTIVEMNPFAEMALGFASLEVKGQPIENVIVGADNLVPALQSAQEGIPIHNLGNVRLHRRDGVAFLAHVRVLPVISDDRLQGVLILLRDLSEHEQVQLRNQQLEQRAILGEVTAIFAHEVRNPVNNISTGLQLMMMELDPENPQYQFIDRLEQDCKRINHLVDQILSYARPAEHKLEKVDLNQMLDRLLERWRPRMARVKVQYHLLNAAKNPCVMGDIRSLEQVFTNLVGNAVQAMSEQGGTLSITIRTNSSIGERDQVEISVADNGPGIPEEHRLRIFEPFFTTNKSGTGLGLAIAKRIINAHKGTISVASVPGGTAFQVLLPAADDGVQVMN
jgi:two-component system, NtrC family, sensor histidine kinase AtoS